jgi:Tfp pilus assembly protein PilE
MTLLPALVAVLLAVPILVLVLYPLYRHAPFRVVQKRAAAGLVTTQAEFEQAARAALKEIELDYQLGNLAETDYRKLREYYTRRAFAAMKSRQQSEEAIDALIEERLRQLKEKDENRVDEIGLGVVADIADISDDATRQNDDA